MKPLAVSMGDPAGVGLELAARVWAQRNAESPRFCFFGDPDALKRAAARLELAEPRLRVFERDIDLATEDDADSDTLDVVRIALRTQESPGSPEPANAAATVEAIERATEAVLRGAASALVTLPIAKSVLLGAGFKFAGHTEFVGDLTRDTPWRRARGPVMMLASPSLKVALATVHMPLAQVAASLDRQRIVDVGRVLGEALRDDFGIAAPRIALCALNPHAGEAGHIGREEIDSINPAAAALRADGWSVSDARSADALFHEQARATYDAVIALYHDQGLIPVKTLHFWDAVNVTLGLPIVRTSPDHGAGFDIAGTGVARIDSFRAALALAREISTRRATA